VTGNSGVALMVDRARFEGMPPVKARGNRGSFLERLRFQAAARSGGGFEFQGRSSSMRRMG
jgi:hypothetical protein